MQVALSKIIGYKIKGIDGELGKLKEFYFDDATWAIRYMVVETGKWLSGRRVLVSLNSLGNLNWNLHTFTANLTREQVRRSPETDMDKPISRKHEFELHRHYAWNNYWGGGFYIMPSYGMGIPYPIDISEEEIPLKARKINPGLRNTRETAGYHIHATDGDIGHVEDFIVDNVEWQIRYLVVNTSNWLPGRRVLVSPKWIKDVDWIEDKVTVAISRDAVRRSPAYDHSEPVSVDYEGKLHEHFKMEEGASWVTFKIHATPKSKVYLAGTFNNWDPASIRLEGDGKGVFYTTVLVPPGISEYKFIVDGNWCNAPDCKDQVPNTFGTTNSVLFVSPEHKGHLHTFSRFSAGQLRPLWGTPMGG